MAKILHAQKGSVETIRNIALGILSKRPDGCRFSELYRDISKQDNTLKTGTIRSVLVGLETRFPDKIYKPDKGVFRLVKFKENETEQPDKKITNNAKKKMIKEDDFYQPFADWLVNELEECTKAFKLGGNVFRDKWGTPDVIGIRESKRSDIIQFPTEIVVGEIKTDSNGLITAFGQACAYRIFSHKSYIVVPNNSQIEDIIRLDALCRQFGIGLILFNNQNPKDPNFEIRVRAIKREPDMFFVNRNLKLIEDKL